MDGCLAGYEIELIYVYMYQLWPTSISRYRESIFLTNTEVPKKKKKKGKKRTNFAPRSSIESTDVLHYFQYVV